MWREIQNPELFPTQVRFNEQQSTLVRLNTVSALGRMDLSALVRAPQTNTLNPSPKCFQSPKFSDSDFREVRGLGLGRPKSSGKNTSYLAFNPKIILAIFDQHSIFRSHLCGKGAAAGKPLCQNTWTFQVSYLK
jgi:hypothetical protein